MIAGLAAGLLLLVTAWTTGASAEPMAGPAPVLKYVTLNVFHGGVLSGLTGNDEDLDRRLEIVAEELSALGADIVGLQEVSTSRRRGNVAARLAARLGFHYVYAPSLFRLFASEWHNRLAAALLNFTEGPAIVSRFPIVTWEAHKLPRCGRFFDPRVLLTAPLLVAVLLGLILVWKTVAGGAAVLTLGYGFRVATVVGLSLAQIGEFSFVLLQQGLSAGLISRVAYQTFLAAAIVTMVATPFLSEASHALALRVARSKPKSRAAPPPQAADGLVLVVGFGHMGETVARVLKRAGVPFRVIDLDPDRVKRGVKLGVPIEYGDSTNDVVLRRSGIEGARAAIVLVSDLRAARATIRHCRTLAPKLLILARTRYIAEIPGLAAAGADEVVAEEFETSLEIADRTLRRLGFPLPWVESETEEIRRTREDGFRRFRAPGAPQA